MDVLHVLHHILQVLHQPKANLDTLLAASTFDDFCFPWGLTHYIVLLLVVKAFEQRASDPEKTQLMLIYLHRGGRPDGGLSKAFFLVFPCRLAVQ